LRCYSRLRRPRLNLSAKSRLLIAAAAALVIVAAMAAARFAFDPREAVAWLGERRAYAEQHLALMATLYAAAYVTYAALSLPVIWIVSVAGGMLFGPWLGLPLVATCSATGATLAMLASRYLLRETVAARFPDFARRVDEGVRRDGARWLFAARLTPVIPFFAINLAVGLTRMPALVFAGVSFAGALPLAFLYVWAGSQFADIEHPGDVLSLPVAAALLALAAAPFALKAIARRRG